MDPLADPFIPGQEYAIPSDWGRLPAQQPRLRTSPTASIPANEGYSDLPPVIHRFQKPPVEPKALFEMASQTLGTKRNRYINPSLVGLNPENQHSSSGSSAMEDLPPGDAPFQVIDRSKPFRSHGRTPLETIDNARSPNEINLGKLTGEDPNMNEQHLERYSRDRALQDSESSTLPSRRMIMKVDQSIRDYMREADKLGDETHWSGFRDIAVAQEVWSVGREGHDDPVELEPNHVAGPYASIHNYLERHYMLLREDAIAPLRDAVSEVQDTPHMTEKDSREDSYIYEKVYITGFTFAQSGIAAHLSFSLKRIGKQINWEHSRRLRTGSIVALTPARDGFNSICCVAVVAARPLAALQQNPPEIDIYFGTTDEIEIDPQVEWIMVESRNGFYESHRHTLRALQMLAKESTATSVEDSVLKTGLLFDHIVDLEREIGPPEYIVKQPIKDLRPLFPEHGEMSGDVLDINVLEEWPNLPCSLDDCQMEALKRILTKRLAIVQGPPGTGKTFISVIALHLMLHNMNPSSPPIIIAAHTNHALDQLLRQVARFEPDFIRVGARTTDVEVIKPRTLYEIKQAIRPKKMSGGLRIPALSALRQLTSELGEIIEPLTLGKEILSAGLFERYKIISHVQLTSLVKGAKEWINADARTFENEIVLWLGDEKVEVERRVTPEDFGVDVEFEEIDWGFEQIKETEAESRLLDDDNDREMLRGTRVILTEPWTGRKNIDVSHQTIEEELEKRDMWDIPTECRGPVYRRMQQLLKDAIREEFREKAQRYAELVRDAKIGSWEVNHNYLRQARIIGMTTTGLSKYRGLIQSLRPKVILVEEAAQTLESCISVACMRSVEHLVLIGDHQQLRGSANDHGLEGNPFYLDVSMFERLVRNHIEFSQLKLQRRMIPEIRRALKPIYDDLEDHPSVHKRAPIPGMGSVNTFFFTHKARESNDNQMSKVNCEEADMIVGFYIYLNHNGIRPDEITVLTFYNGQRKLILRKLRGQTMLRGERLNVVTVDSYQGEENTIVLLSLVRSNEWRKIGFLEIENRVCVALSRAQRGFYIFGDAENLCKSSMLWWYVVQAMAQKPCRVGFHLPLTCTNHRNTTFVKDPEDLFNLCGGCNTMACREELACGHVCSLKCHPFSHDFYDCPKRCTRQLLCGHPCTQICSTECKASCSCDDNSASDAIGVHCPDNHNSKDTSPVSGGTLESMWDLTNWQRPRSGNYSKATKAFNDFAQGGHVQSDRTIAKRAEKEAAEARRKKAEMDQFDAMYGGPPKPAQTENTNGMKQVRTEIDDQGATRTIYRETYTPLTPDPAAQRQMKESLLDM